jgi:hypothetical protein
MTEAQIAMLTANVFLAAWIGKHWMNFILFAAYFTMAFLK